MKKSANLGKSHVFFFLFSPILLLGFLSASTLIGGATNISNKALPTSGLMAVCGDGFCGYSENSNNCLVDCHCGNYICEWESFGETWLNCLSDCGCGDGICDGDEDKNICSVDCVICGDGVCDSNFGEPTTCPTDCDGPYFSFHKETANPSLHYLSCGEACQTSTQSENLDDYLSSGIFTAMDLANDRTASVAYVIQNNPNSLIFNLSLVKCMDRACSNVSTPKRISGTLFPVGPIDMKIGGDGNPLIAFISGVINNNEVNPPFSFNLIHCNDPLCNSFTEQSIVSNVLYFSFSPSIAIGTDGFAYISYIDVNNELIWSFNLEKFYEERKSENDILTLLFDVKSVDGRFEISSN